MSSLISRRPFGELFYSIPSMAWLAIFFVIPTTIIFAFALKPADINGGIGEGWDFTTLGSIVSASTIKIICRTAWMSGAATIICLALAIPTGYYIARAPRKLQHLLLLLVVMPSWSSFIVRIFAWKSLLHPEGFLKKLLVTLHIIHPDTILLYNSATVVLVMVYTYLPFAVLPIYAAAAKFNFQLFEAAMDLGMDRLRVFIKVFIPGIRNAVLTATIMVLIPALGGYVIPDVVGGPHNEMIGNKIVQRTFVDRNLPQASALAAFLALSILAPLAMVSLLRLRSAKLMQVRAKA